MKKKISKTNLISCVKSSYVLDFLSSAKIWFTHIDLTNFPESITPCNSYIVEKLITFYDLDEFQYFLILVENIRTEHWHKKKDPVPYQYLIEVNLQKFSNHTQIKNFNKRGCVWKNILSLENILEIFKENQNSLLESVAKNRKAVIVDYKEPLQLKVLKITKPWGYEGWYTGVEERGVVKVLDKHGETELPYALSLFKNKMLANDSESLILLKTLNPSAEKTVGDLYYEMHEKKWEVYIVTKIDKSAWPSGKGIIKAGLHTDKIAEYKNKYGGNWKETLLKDFKSAVFEYEKTRRLIDDYKEEISKELLEKEEKLRDIASGFVGDLPVKVGDIISFPVFQIHSLRHGIKVIEFQTPHYERLILMFAQKVLTQNHWDTENVISKMETEVYYPPKLNVIHKSDYLKVERFTDFPQFNFDRIRLDPNKSFKTQLDGRYQLLIVISGQAEVFSQTGNSIKLTAEDSIFLPVAMESYRIESIGNNQLICLNATPK